MTCGPGEAEPGRCGEVELPSLYQQFNWSNRKVWELDLRPEQAALSEIEWHLHAPLWSSVPGQRLFDLRPVTVLGAPHLHPWHAERVRNADTRHPIDMLWWDDRYVILDGVHRLARLRQLAAPTVWVRRIPASWASRIASDLETDD